jgi:hypothetical protein
MMETGECIVDNSIETTELKRAHSTASSSGSWIVEPLEDTNEDILESVFEWFSQNNIIRGNPERIYGDHIKTKTVVLTALNEINENSLTTPSLLKRRMTKL